MRGASIALAVMSTHNDLYVQDPLAAARHGRSTSVANEKPVHEADYPRPPWVSRSLLALVFVGSMAGSKGRVAARPADAPLP